MKNRRLPTQVLWLGVVSFATDVSSDMIYPLLPLFLTGVLGASAATLGGIEGAAETVAALLKIVSGRLADRGRRKPLTLLGYGISSLMRPLAAFAQAPWHILVVRLSDRVGKGIRSSPRDAIVADVTPADQRGRAYGYHRAMDNAGAVLGPALATALLIFGKLDLRHVFLLAAIPGVIAMASLFFGVVEPDKPVTSAAPALKPDWQGDERSLVRTYVALGFFALGNASDAFLLLRAQQLGVSVRLIPILWLVHNAVKALLSIPGGALSDRIGRRRVILVGWAIYVASYLGFGWASQAWQIWALMAVYAVYYALTEGTEKAMIADLAGAARRGRAFGVYYAVIGLAALPASFGFGLLGERYGARVPFSVAAGLAGLAALLLAAWVPQRPRR